MGVNIMFKMRHILDVRSVEVVVEELQTQLNCKVGGFINPVDIDILEDLKLPYPKYKDTSSVDIYVEDEYQVARSLIAVYGDGAREHIANCPDYQYIINQIEEVNQGLYNYVINHNTSNEFVTPEIWYITNDTISGMPGFGSDRWGIFYNALDRYSKSDNKCLTDIVNKGRRRLYKFIKPLLKDEYIYYHADQGVAEGLCYLNYFDDIPNFLAKINHDVFELSEYILTINSSQVFDRSDVQYIIKDDFKDIM